VRGGAAHTDRVVRVFVCGLVALALLVVAPIAGAKDRGEVRVAGVCGGGGKADFRLRSRDDAIELRFEVENVRAGGVWRVVVVHERRVAWKGSVRASGGSYEVRRTLPDLAGADAVSVRALGPRGVVCRAAATLVDE
jgi:hypothetical protein